MNIVTLKSPAKVNLTLDVLGRDEKTGYHLMQTILHEVQDLYDELSFEVLDSPEISIECDHPDVPTDESNTIHRAATLLQKKYAPTRGATIKLKKNIPPRSGLGGPSSNAATTLKALNQLWGIEISEWTLRNHAADIGMDVPFFITGGAAIGMHFGEQLMHLPTIDKLPTPLTIEIIKTGVQVSTKEAFEQFKSQYSRKAGERNRDTGRFVKILKGEKSGDIRDLLHNDFEAQFFAQNPELKEKHPNSHLTGTGGVLFKLI